jgi:transposase
MEKASIIGVDLAKHVFQVHGASADGSVAFRRKLSRSKLDTSKNLAVMAVS